MSYLGMSEVYFIFLADFESEKFSFFLLLFLTDQIKLHTQSTWVSKSKLKFDSSSSKSPRSSVALVL